MRGTGNHIPPKYMQECPQDNTGAYCDVQLLAWLMYQTNSVHTEVAREIAAGYASLEHYGYYFATFASSGTVNKTGLLDAIRHEIANHLKDIEAGMSDIKEHVWQIRYLMALQFYIERSD